MNKYLRYLVRASDKNGKVLGFYSERGKFVASHEDATPCSLKGARDAVLVAHLDNWIQVNGKETTVVSIKGTKVEFDLLQVYVYPSTGRISIISSMEANPI